MKITSFHHKNKIRNRKSILCLLILLISGLLSCKKFVQISPPANLLVSKTLFSDNSTATSAQLAVYIQMVSKAPNGESYLIAKNCGLLADEFRPLGNNLINNQLYTNNLSAAAGSAQ